MDDRLPHVQYKKPSDEWFVTRMRLHAAAEVYLASYSVPTRPGPSGHPEILQVSAAAIQDAHATLSEMLGDHRPHCQWFNTGAKGGL